MSASNNTKKNGNGPRRISFSLAGFLLILLLVLTVIGYLGWQAGLLSTLLPEPSPGISQPANTEDTSISPTPAATDLADSTAIVEIDPQIPTLPPFEEGILPGMIYLSISEAGYAHLFAYHPENLPFTRLTFGEWDDRYPAVSPDGRQIAFSSNRAGQWDIYLLTLESGEVTQVTDDMAYDGNPAWSSDGLWLAYEKYAGDNLDIYIKPAIADLDEIRVTSHPAPDFHPAWQPGSTVLAFTSTRTSTRDIFFIDTASNGSESTLQNYTNNRTADQFNPVWKPDGASISWISPSDGYDTIFLAQVSTEAAFAEPLTAANQVVWDPSGNYLLSLQRSPDAHFLAIQDAASLRYHLLPTPVQGQVHEVNWGIDQFPASLPISLRRAATADPESPWQEKLVPSTGALFGRQNLIDLPDITAPHAGLNALAVEPFYALKDRIYQELGWDVLSDLENMFVSISQPLSPEQANDWLYTGRAFSLNPVLIEYGYMVVVREDFGHQTYWRVYLKPLDQSGNQGMPLTQLPWDFDARFSGNTTAYEAGGEQYGEIPTGYWVDFTALALDFGWERQQALTNWRSYYQGARFNVFVITSGLNWEDAMLQVWPPEIFQP